MSSRKCALCGFVNWSDAETCKRCDAALTGDATADLTAVASAESGEEGRKVSTWKQIVRALLWALVVQAGAGAALFASARVYDWATGAPPMQSGPPHNFPDNPFVLLAILIVSPCFAPFAYVLIVIALLLFFERRARRRAGG